MLASFFRSAAIFSLLVLRKVNRFKLSIDSLESVLRFLFEYICSVIFDILTLYLVGSVESLLGPSMILSPFYYLEFDV